VAGALATAALLLAVVLTLTTLAPAPQPSDAKIVATVHLGGQPQDAVLAGGSLWIADFDGRVLRLDPATHRVREQIVVGGTPRSITAGGGVVWVISHDSGTGVTSSHLVKLDARSGRVLARVPTKAYGGSLAFGAGGLWLSTNEHGGDVERIDPDSSQRTAFFPFETGSGLAVAGNAVWALRPRSVLQIDPATGSVTRIGGIASLGSDGEGAVLADRHGAWITGPNDGLLRRIEGGRVTRRIAVGDQAGVIAEIGSAIWVSAWVSTSRTLQDGNEVVRVDPEDGKVVQRIDVGYRVPKALVPVGKDLWVITSDGEAMLVSPE
jgi:sugar lactone lactonase YvrE